MRILKPIVGFSIERTSPNNVNICIHGRDGGIPITLELTDALLDSLIETVCEFVESEPERVVYKVRTA